MDGWQSGLLYPLGKRKCLNWYQRFESFSVRHFKTIFKWFKLLFNKKKTIFKKEIIKFKPYHFEYSHSLDHCKEHWDYIPMRPPTNNCNICLEIYNKKASYRQID